MKKILKSDGMRSLIASLICIILGILIGYIVLLCINPEGAGEAILAVIKNFLNYNRSESKLQYFGTTLVRTAPLLMCALSVLFSYKVGLFNIGASGQFTAGACVALYGALAWNLSWLPCTLLAIAAGMLLGSIVGILKAKFNVNEVISGIMLNWIALYLTNFILTNVKEPTSPYTYNLLNMGRQAFLPTLGLGKLFMDNSYVGIAIPLAVIAAIVIEIILKKTVFGYELKASGLNKHAAKYAGMNENRNIILTLAISGGLAGLSAVFLYLTGIEQWTCTASSVPAMGFNGIAATFLGGLNPIGTIFSSFFIQQITSGGAYIDKNLYCSQISDLICSIIIYLCGFVFFIKGIMAKKAESSSKENAKGGSK